MARGVAALDVVEAGQRRAVLVGGDAGVGKTRYVEELLAHARARGWLIAAANCASVGDLSAPLGSWKDLAVDLAAQLGEETCSALGGSGWQGLQELLSEGPSRWTASTSQLLDLMHEVLVAFSRQAPLVVVIEDVHWADPFTVNAITSLVRSRRPARLLVVVTWRTEDITRGHPLLVQIGEWHRAPSVVAVDVRPLGEVEVRQMLCGQLGREVNRALVRTFMARTGGNPLLVEELLRVGIGQPMPSQLRGVLDSRFVAVSAAGRELLAAASLLGQTFDPDLVAQVLSWTAVEMDEALRENLGQNLIVATESGRYGFRHALIREYAHTDLMPAARRALHQEIALVLMVRGGEGGTEAALAFHWAEAGDIDQALIWSLRAARTASASLAHAEATDLYRRALRWWDDVADAEQLTGLRRSAVRVMAARAALLAADLDSLEEWCRDALGDTNPVEDPRAAADWWAMYAEAARLAGDDEERETRLGQAADLLKATPEGPHAAILAELARLTSLHGDPVTGLADAETALRLALESMDAAAEAASLHAIAMAQSMVGQDPVNTFWSAIARATEAGADLVLFRCYVNLTDTLLRRGSYRECVAAAERGVEQLTGRGMLHACAGTLLGNAAQAMIATGEWATAASALEQAITLEESAPVGWFLDELRATLLIRRGQAPAAVQLLAQSTEAVQRLRRSDDDLLRRRTVTAEALQQSGRYSEALTEVEQGLKATTTVWDAAAQITAIGAQLVVALDQQGRSRRRSTDPDLTEEPRLSAVVELLRSIVRRLRPDPGSSAEAWVALARAEMTRTSLFSQADAQAANDHPWVAAPTASQWADLVERWSELGCPYESSYAIYRQAEALLLSQGRRDEADHLLRESMDTAARLGAEGLSGDINALRRRAGLVRQKGDGSNLTEREQEVLQLLTIGSTNKQIGQSLFITEKTASVHVSNLLRKLGVASRLEAAAIAHLRSRDLPLD
jgi:DNA-binding CsgD family transcriptional regulator